MTEILQTLAVLFLGISIMLLIKRVEKLERKMILYETRFIESFFNKMHNELDNAILNPDPPDFMQASEEDRFDFWKTSRDTGPIHCDQQSHASNYMNGGVFSEEMSLIGKHFDELCDEVQRRCDS